MSVKPSRIAAVGATLLLTNILLVPAPLVAQVARSAATAASASETKPWRIKPRFEAKAEYDNNVFLLPAKKFNNVTSPSAAEQQSGRFADMKSPGDVITTLAASFDAKGSGLTGRTLTITPSVAYELYLQNGARSNASLGVEIEQLLPHEGRMRLRGRLLPSYFARNYLADAVDLNADRMITPDERVYARGEYGESELRADYRRRLVKSTKSHPFGAWLTVAAGFASRANKAPFAVRDFSGPTGALRLQFDLANGVELQTSYDIAILGSQPTSQVLLLDEAPFAQDLNANGNMTDINVRSVQTVDRSHTEHGLEETAHFSVNDNTSIDVSIDYRWRSFSSSERYDVGNNGRRDHRLGFGAELTRRLSKAVRLDFGIARSAQVLNRRADLGALGEVDDYQKLLAHVGVRIAR